MRWCSWLFLYVRKANSLQLTKQTQFLVFNFKRSVYLRKLVDGETNSVDTIFRIFRDSVLNSEHIFTYDGAHVWEISLPWNRNSICGADIYDFNSQCNDLSNSIQKSSSLLQKNFHGVSSVHNRDRSLCGECSLHWRSHNAIFVFFPWKTVSWRRWHSHNFRIHWNQQFNPYGHCYVRGSTCVGRLPTLLSKHG